MAPRAHSGVAEPGARSAPAGLVSYAIVPTSDETAGDLRSSFFDFPSAQMIAVAASMWPDAPSSDGHDWHIRELREVKNEGQRADGRRRVWYSYEPIAHGEFRNERAGVWPRVEIGPGMVRFSRKDDARAEAARARAADPENAARAAERAYLVQLENSPMALADVRVDRPSRVVAAWSAKSRNALRREVASLDLSELVAGESLPAMVTLTLPGDWLAVAPDAATMARKFDRFVNAYVSKWGPLRCIWKREFQKRGAPHYHLWMVPPLPQSRMGEFRSWLSAAWTRILFKGIEWSHGDDHKTSGKCSCCEYCRSLGAGTGVDFVAGLRARDPNRLAEYFLKESGHSEAKAYQNAAPVEWEGQSIGRFWGVRGISKSVETIAVDPVHQYRVWRVMRKVRLARSLPTHDWMVPRSVKRGTGEVRSRKVARRTRITSAAGWIAVNDGASFGAALGRYASSLEQMFDHDVEPALVENRKSVRRGNRWRRVWSNRPSVDFSEVGMPLNGARIDSDGLTPQTDTAVPPPYLGVRWVPGDAVPTTFFESQGLATR